MAIRSRDIYEGRKKRRSRKKVIVYVALGLLAAVILLFYGLRSLCVYDDLGNARIVWPFSQEAKDIKAAEEGQTGADYDSFYFLSFAQRKTM